MHYVHCAHVFIRSGKLFKLFSQLTLCNNTNLYFFSWNSQAMRLAYKSCRERVDKESCLPCWIIEIFSEIKIQQESFHRKLSLDYLISFWDAIYDNPIRVNIHIFKSTIWKLWPEIGIINYFCNSITYNS